jgi:hypothetical protein
MTSITSRRTLFLAGAAVAVIVLGLWLALRPGQSKSNALRSPLHRGSAISPQSNRPAILLHADHPTYADAQSLRETSESVVIGTVLSQTTDPGVSPGSAPDGTSLPPIPETYYRVHIQRALKGGFGLVDSDIAVGLTGGASPDGKFVLDGGPILSPGVAYMFFARAGANATWYPLAGGAAIAEKQSDDSYLLSGEVSGQNAISFTTATVAPPLSVRVRYAMIDMHSSPLADRAQVLGSFKLQTGMKFVCGDEVDVGIDAPAIAQRLIGSSFRKVGTQCQYDPASAPDGPIAAFTIDMTQQTFSLRLKREVAVSSLTNPIRIDVQFGISQGSQTLQMQEQNQVWIYSGN